ncbi:MAG: response regulator transcription factor [Clostridia bacterium]|nr:response regulator transcription factor [Clostridia bacterium]
MRILVAEDERHLLDVLKKRLIKEHYSVDVCSDGLDAMDYINTTAYDGIILDIMLPRLDGISILRQMRRAGNDAPVLLLTARGSVEDRVAGLDAGADDYLIKPFAFEELLARIRVMMRKQSSVRTKQEELNVGDLCLNLRTHEVMRGGDIIGLSSKEYAVLEYMMRHSGTVLSRTQIEQHVWNYDYLGASNMVDVYIRYLRKKLDDPYDEKLIHTVRGKGYVIREK